LFPFDYEEAPEATPGSGLVSASRSPCGHPDTAADRTRDQRQKVSRKPRPVVRPVTGPQLVQPLARLVRWEPRPTALAALGLTAFLLVEARHRPGCGSAAPPASPPTDVPDLTAQRHTLAALRVAPLAAA
jgi:hypothetical protein